MVNGLFEAVNGVYAAGGAASFVDPAMGRRHSGSHDHCVNSGLIAGGQLAGGMGGVGVRGGLWLGLGSGVGFGFRFGL